MIKRALLSLTVVDAIAQYTKFPTALSRTPVDAGWAPAVNKAGSSFVPYSIVNPGGASHSEGPVAGSQSDWWLPYTIGSYGVDPGQTEFLADSCRTAIGELHNQALVLDDASYYIQQVRVDSIGGLVRADVLDPPYWVQSDTVSIWVSKEF